MKVCPNCGSSFDDSMRFCVQCGTTLIEQAAPEASDPEAPAAEQAAPEAPEAVATETAAPEAPAPEQAAPQPEFQQPQYAEQQYAGPNPAYAPPYGAPAAPFVDPDDHTGEMDPADIAENKLYAMLVYLLGPVGIIIALLADKESAFLKFHIKLSIRYYIVELILMLLSCTVILAIPASICVCIVAVLEIITFVQVCKGQAKDPAIIKKIKFLY